MRPQSNLIVTPLLCFFCFLSLTMASVNYFSTSLDFIVKVPLSRLNTYTIIYRPFDCLIHEILRESSLDTTCHSIGQLLLSLWKFGIFFKTSVIPKRIHSITIMISSLKSHCGCCVVGTKIISLSTYLCTYENTHATLQLDSVFIVWLVHP